MSSPTRARDFERLVQVASSSDVAADAKEQTVAASAPYDPQL
jgi:hypothetical protein